MTLRVDLPYLMADRDRHGNERIFARRNGRKIRLREEPGTQAFLTEYHAALARIGMGDGAAKPGKERAAAGTLRWLVGMYFAGSTFRGLDPKSQATRRLILEDCLQEPRTPNSRDLMGACPVTAMMPKHVQMLRDRKQAKPGAANNRLKYLSAMFSWAVENNHMTANPARDVKPLRYISDGFYTWTTEDVQKFEAFYAVGTKPRLALALLLFTGARRGDVVTFGKQHVKDGWLAFVPRKTRYRRMTLSQKPILPELADIIAKSPTGDLAFLVTKYGRPFTAAGFGGWFRAQCDLAGLPRCTAHGLRKAGATIAAENGATDRQLMALYDWTTASQASVYTKAADRKRLAGEAMKLVSPERSAIAPRADAAPPLKNIK